MGLAVAETRDLPEGSANRTHISDLWPKLDEATRAWFLDHPGIQIVPRTITSELNQAAGQTLPHDAHGQYRMASRDTLFIREQAHSSYAIQGIERAPDSVHPENDQR